ncbi:MAG: DUF5519 family protein, partial [Calditrichaeota bacterium]|nr:DUF5519 family protein [Calditrichota bacterium]
MTSDLKQQLTRKILSIVGVTERFWPTDSGGFTAFVFKNKEFAHFHSGNELDLKLTKKLIAAKQLQHPENSTVHPNR